MTEKSTTQKIFEELCDTYEHQCQECKHIWETKYKRKADPGKSEGPKPTKCKNQECTSNTNEFYRRTDDLIKSEIKLDFYTTQFHYSWSEVKESMDDATNAKETLVGATKFAGKILANTGLTLGKTSFFAAKHTLKNLPSIAAHVATSVLDKGNGNLSGEQTDRLRETVEKNKGRKLF